MKHKQVIKPIHVQNKWIGVLVRTREQINRVWLIPYKYKIDWVKLNEYKNEQSNKV